MIRRRRFIEGALAGAPVLAALPAIGRPLARLEAAGAQVIYATDPPGGAFGYNGFDVFDQQRVASRFPVPAGADLRLAAVGVYFMNNSDRVMRRLRLSIQTDALDEGGPATLPSGRVLESWVGTAGTLGWNPVEQVFRSVRPVPLRGGANYWIVAESRAPAGLDPVWTFAKRGLQFSATSLPDGSWQPAGEGGALTLRIGAR